MIGIRSCLTSASAEPGAMGLPGRRVDQTVSSQYANSEIMMYAIDARWYSTLKVFACYMLFSARDINVT